MTKGKKAKHNARQLRQHYSGSQGSTSATRPASFAESSRKASSGVSGYARSTTQEQDFTRTTFYQTQAENEEYKSYVELMLSSVPGLSTRVIEAASTDPDMRRAFHVDVFGGGPWQPGVYPKYEAAKNTRAGAMASSSDDAGGNGTDLTATHTSQSRSSTEKGSHSRETHTSCLQRDPTDCKPSSPPAPGRQRCALKTE